ncbi:hypothetical protein PJ985_11075 [Streptomyces sp. ACA25]|nr:hypothetical protein [Streptomyces sp. ACA25]MDB1088107.1 hypothetical protein [Streptomyces sp. ACA25]
MDRQGGRHLQLRPLRGGLEWDADPARVRPATTGERLSAAVAEANAASRDDRLRPLRTDGLLHPADPAPPR